MRDQLLPSPHPFREIMVTDQDLIQQSSGRDLVAPAVVADSVHHAEIRDWLGISTTALQPVKLIVTTLDDGETLATSKEKISLSLFDDPDLAHAAPL
jgi:hypothetical protein